MEIQKIINLLGDANNESLKFSTRKWYVINDQNNTDYGEGNEDSTTVEFETEVIKSNLCDYSDAYVLVTGFCRDRVRDRVLQGQQQVVMLILQLHLKVVLHLRNS